MDLCICRASKDSGFEVDYCESEMQGCSLVSRITVAVAYLEAVAPGVKSINGALEKKFYILVNVLSLQKKRVF